MKDLIAKLQMDANCALGAIWMHIEAREKRIAELEAQQAFGIGETYANALSRIAELESEVTRLSASWRGDATVADALEEHIAELEAQIAAAPVPVVEEKDLWALLPNSAWYLDPPDGGNVSLLEQLQRMSKDAAAYRSTALQAPGREVPETAIPALVAALQDCLDYGSMTGSEWVADQAREAIKQAAPVQEPKP